MYHYYSKYEDCDNNNFFKSLDDAKDLSNSVLLSLTPSPTTLIPNLPAINDTSILSIIVEVSIIRWMDGSETLDPNNLDLLSEIIEILAAVYYQLLPPSEAVIIDFGS